MSRRILFLVVAAAVSILLSNAAFVPSNYGASRARMNQSRLMVVPTQDDILAAYQQRIGVKKAAAKAAASIQAPPTEPLPEPSATESLQQAVPPVVVETPPPVEAVQAPALSDVVEQVEKVTATPSTFDPASGMDPISSIKELSNVDLKASIQNLRVPDFKSLSVPDFKSLTVPDFKNIDIRNIDLSKIQFPTPPERPEAPGVILPDGARMKTLFDIYGKPELPSSFSLPAIFEALRISEFGAWYLAGFMLLAWQIQAQSTQALYQEKLSQAETKARQAAEAASIAAEGATLTKKLATSNKGVKLPKSTETILSESQQEALRLEKEEMKRKLETLQQETEALKRQLKVAKGDENVVNGVAPSAAANVVKPKIVEPIDAETNAQVLEIIKKQDEANAAKAAATKAAAPKKTAKKKAEPKKKSAKKAEPKKERVMARKEPNVAVMEPIVVVEEEVEVEHIRSGDVFFANITEVEEVAKPKKAATKKAAPKKSTQVKEAVEAASAALDNPWKSLAPSALKRKTVKDLSAYLTERDVHVTDEAGKPLKKAELLDKLMDL